jgi:predicted PurR-regulated permease PerM
VAYAFGDERGQEIMRIAGSINAAVSKYLAVKTFTSFLTALLSVLVLAAFGVKYAVLWAILTFFANFIPYIGSMVAVALPIAMSFVQFPDALYKPIVVLVLLTLVQQLIGSVIEPRLIGKKLGVSPLIILLSLAFWGMLWGIPGMILSAPLVVSIKIILENIEYTRSIARLCSNV